MTNKNYIAGEKLKKGRLVYISDGCAFLLPQASEEKETNFMKEYICKFIKYDYEQKFMDRIRGRCYTSRRKRRITNR